MGIRGMMRRGQRATIRTAHWNRSAATATAVAPRYCIKTYNAISPIGLQVYPSQLYQVSPDEQEPHAIMLRSYGLSSDEVAPSVRAIARCGAGTNNVPVDAMSERGIPVFNSPGANANAVKELVLCSLLLASRGITQSVRAIDQMLQEETDASVIKKRVEGEKKKFGGQEIQGKTLGVIGLGHIGASVAEAALKLGMKIVAFDPSISLEAAWRLPGGQVSTTVEVQWSAGCAPVVDCAMYSFRSIACCVWRSCSPSQITSRCMCLTCRRRTTCSICPRCRYSSPRAVPSVRRALRSCFWNDLHLPYECKQVLSDVYLTGQVSSTLRGASWLIQKR
jgi:hypothetical protein